MTLIYPMFAMVVLTVIVLFFVMLASESDAAAVKNLKNCDGVYSGTYKNVTVQPGGSCTLTPDATVLGGVHAKKGAENLYVQTAVGLNVQAHGVTGTVYVGPGPNKNGKLCTYDPPVGNNVMVKDSHNVLICYVHADNNIKVTDNDGCITVRKSVAENNLTVARNEAFTGDCNAKHSRPGAIRVLKNGYGNQLTVKDNSGRLELVKKNYAL